ncbi:PorP/SprF family type IX secretion system membrane protein [Flavobacterium chungangense]|uniref:PorP/SprF family type IX secretion system membrane protein n=1 Tax=Flavobacterium chungangense TaxID=554283 RepID=UPI0004DF5B8C|nr:PorP/SprF family type IX secretion system membrane protein [Flavobacterium chungangense]
MKKFLLFLTLLYGTSQLLYSQDTNENGVVSFSLPVRNSLKFNRYLINPTFSFVREQNPMLSFYNKRQYVQFDDAPNTYLFNYSGRLKENDGYAIGLFQQNYGLMTVFGGVVNFAHNIVLQEDSNLTFGLNVGAYQSGLDKGKITSDDVLDADYPSNTLIAINPGINYGTAFLDFGLSMNNLVLYNFGSGMVKEDPEKAIQLHAMYTGYIDSYGFFDQSKFSGIVKTEIKKDNTIISGLAMLTMPQGIWAQAGYNTLYGLSGGLGVNITANIAIEYNYERGLGNFTNLGASHEFVIAYKFKNTRYYYGDDEEGSLIDTSKPKPKPVIAKKSTPTVTRVDGATKAKLAAEAKAKADAEAQKARLAAAEKVKADAEASAKAKLDADNKAKADAEALKIKLAAENKIKADAEATKSKLLAEARAKADAEEAKRKAEAKAKTEAADLQSIIAADAKAKADSDALQARIAAEAKAKAAAEAKTKAAKDAAIKAKAAADAKARTAALLAEKERLAAEAKLKVDAEERQARIAAEAKAKADAEALQAKLVADAKAKADAEALKIKLAADAKAKADAEAIQAKLAADAKAKADAEALQAKLVADAKAKADMEALQAKLLADAKVKADAEATNKAKAEQEAKQLKLAEEAKAKAKADAEALQAKLAADLQAKLAAEAKAKADAEALQAKLAADAKAKADAEALAAAAQKDETAKELDNLTQLVENSGKAQSDLIAQFNSTVANKQKDLNDMKEENDLSEKGIYKEPKPFKSVSAENAQIESLKGQIADANFAQKTAIANLTNLYNERLKKVPNKDDALNRAYLEKINQLKAAQLKAEQDNIALIANLERIKTETEIEKKRRIKRAAYENDQGRYAQDLAALKRIKETTKLSNTPLTESDFDFGEDQSNMQIIKNIKNSESGYYLIIAVHNSVEKRDEFLTKAVAAGRSDVNFFYNVTTSKYYIYYEKHEDLSEATKALEAKGNKPYNSRMAIVKVEN